ncbi:MAG: hypothetical protein IJX00_01035 [Clostridia bacterium]|nr:hypothetical protein [Clostridia bacterium]
MKTKNFLFRKIFYVLFAFCIFGAGMFTLGITQKPGFSKAENTISEDARQEDAVPSYFSAKEFLVDGSDSTENFSSLIKSNTFMYYSEESVSTQLQLSLATNGLTANTASTNEIYKYVNYADPQNLTNFNFYNIFTIELSVNGQTQNLNPDSYTTKPGLSFNNAESSPVVETFEMNFSNQATAGNNICILDEDGNVVEGLYTLKISLLLFTCTDGGTTAEEELITSEGADIVFNFYVIDRESYLLNGRPNVDSYNFDHSVNVSNLTNPTVANYFYSNYSSNGTADQISYIEYDYTRFEVEISKEIGDKNGGTVNVVYDLDTQAPVVKGDQLVYTTVNEANKTCRVFFTNVGNYVVTYKDILLIDYQTADGQIARKFALVGLSNVTKKHLVYVYGYQANYTDFDKPAINGIRQNSELKSFDLATTSYTNGADITSRFLNSDASFSQANATTTFLASNLTNYINTSGLKPVVTDQKPIDFDSNAKLVKSSSYIYSTKQISNAYSATSYTINGQTLYRKAFSGIPESSEGVYLYIIAYSFDDFWSSETMSGATTTFYQAFYFEINVSIPTIKIFTADDNTNVSTGMFVNRDVIVEDTTLANIYNKDVTVQIIAKDYDTNGWLTGFGDSYGIALKDLVNEGENRITLSRNAHYTIKMYYTNDIVENGLANAQSFRTRYFTIDKTSVQGIKASNVSEIPGSTDSKFVSDLKHFSTNQNIVLSWQEKNSGAATYAYYRYFPLEETTYYSTKENLLSATLERILSLSNQTTYLPVNSILNMSTTNNDWLSYYGNTALLANKNKIASDYVLPDSGLYVVDVYDEAGNHSIEIFMIDRTTPIFVLYDGSSYKITSTSMFVSEQSTLYWGDYKGILIQNFNTVSYTAGYTPENITESDLAGKDFYIDREGNIRTDIFAAMYNTLKRNNYLQNLAFNVSIDSTYGVDVATYAGNYITIPINDISYFMDKANPTYKDQVASKQEIPVTQEMTYRVLIRDMSNTKLDLNYSETALMQYTNFYSARQTLIISFDSSEFFIEYQNSKKETEYLTTNNTEEIVGEGGHTTKISYLNPTRMNKPLTLSYKPTITDGLQIQVESITINYTPYVKAYKLDPETGITYHYYKLSDHTTPIEVYTYNGSNPSVDLKTYDISLNSDNVTTEGKYEITRTYYLGEGYTYNENDFYKRTYILYVDRNEVISNSETVSNAEGTETHLESLIGGDVFVSMYDNKTNASLVITYPNSPEGNTNGSSLYNNGTVRSVLTTNMLPVNVYIPQYKYTISSKKTLLNDAGAYKYEVENNDVMNFYVEDDETTDGDETRIIREYGLYAEIYRNGTDSTNLIAKTARTNYNNPSLADVAADENGFLIFYNDKGNALQQLIDEGTYYVKLYQGMFGEGLDDNLYKQSITFSFDIERSDPNFTAQTTTGGALVSDLATVPNATVKETYFTNQANVNILWDAGSDYMAEIDIEKIVFKTSKGRTFSTADDIFTTAPFLSQKTYLATISLEKLDVYQHNAYVDITMQYKNHDSRFYNTVTKRIAVDLSAPSTNVQALVEKSLANRALYPTFTNAALRTYRTAKGDPATTLDNTSYNISTSTGDFAYYSYTVTSAYLQTLQTIVANEGYITYIRSFTDQNGENTKYVTGSQETSYTESLTGFKNVTEITQLDPHTYYEVVETDKAGNMSIYTIFVMDYTAQPTVNNVWELPENNIITYSDAHGNSHFYTIADYLAVNAYPNAINNIFSKSGFALTELNLFNDAWAQFQLNTINPTSGITVSYNLMLSPWKANKAIAYGVAGNTEFDIDKLINGSVASTRKHNIVFLNRENATPTTFYINIRNTTLNATLTTDQNREYIQFAMPADVEIQSPDYATTFVSSLSISADGQLIYQQENKLGYASLWRSTDNVVVTSNPSAKTIMFEISQELGFAPNTRIVYEYTDNYGTTYKEIHLYRETIIRQEVSSKEDLYSYYDNAGILHYITKDGFVYNYNPSKYVVKTFDFINGTQSTDCVNATLQTTQSADGITTITYFTTAEGRQYNHSFIIEIWDAMDETNLIKTVQFTLYNELPVENTTTNNNLPGQFKLLDASRNNITSTIIGDVADLTGYFSEITILYATSETFIPVKYSVSRDRIHWEEISSGTVLRCQSDDMEQYYLKIWYDETYLRNEYDSTSYVFGKVSNSQIYSFNISSLTSTFWVEKTVNGQTSIVAKSDSMYNAPDGKQFSNHYIVNLDYTQRASVEIKTNKEQKIEPTLVFTYHGSKISSEHWTITNKTAGDLGNIPAFETNIIITYIPTSDDFVEEFYSHNENGIIDTTTNLVNNSSASVVLSQVTLDRIELQWTKFNGIKENEINILLIKDGVEMNPTIYSRSTGTGAHKKEYNYMYLTYSGKYSISLYDTAGNIQKFNRGNSGQTESLNFIFLKDVPFTMTYTDALTGEAKTILPIKQSIFNGDVTVNLDKKTFPDFYTAVGPQVKIKKNGVALTNSEIKEMTTENSNTKQYKFSGAGYYEISFVAESNIPNKGEIRSETYSFSIVNENEYKYSYIYNKYGSYYVEKVEKDGRDITSTLLKILDVSTIKINNKSYMTSLPLSYLDDKTGAGVYTITINTNNNLIKADNITSTFSYKVTIRSGSAPIKISVAQGKATTKAVAVSFNAANIYEEMGECTLKIVRYSTDGKYAGAIYSLKINATTLEEEETTIPAGDSGTYYVQIVSPSGNLLYSYRVEKKEPMNPASIIIIAVAAILVVVLIIVIYKLRKRISVK